MDTGEAVVLVRAANPGPLTLEGTNTWIVGRDPCWVVDPGPDLPAHVAAVAAIVRERGGLGGVALTHGHGDHLGALPGLAVALDGPAPPVGSGLGDAIVRAAGGAPVRLGTGDRLGPLEALATPGHAPEHLAFLRADEAGGVADAFTGDAVLGRGSVFVGPFPGALRGYLDALRELRRRGPARLRPGHGPTIEDGAAEAHLTGYLEHRAAREARLLEALDAGHRGVEALLDAAWTEVPEALRPAAALTLEAHLDKLADEGALPDGVERRDYRELLAHAEP